MSQSEVPNDQRGGLLSLSFLGLTVTQFLGAVNDNIFRWLVVPIGKEVFGPDHEALAVSLGLACFVLPYIVLAAPAGFLADRFSKQRVIIWVKVAEVLIMGLGLAFIAIARQNALAIYALFGVVALMGAQSAMFSPVKFGSIPEIVRPEKISLANGVIGLTTVLAIVIGTGVGNSLYDYTKPAGQEHFGVTAAVLLGVAGVGLLSSLIMRHRPAADPTARFPLNFPAQTFRDLVYLWRHPNLTKVAIGIMFYWTLGALASLTIDQYAIKELGLSQTHVSYLLGTLVIGLGVGNIVAGLLSHGRVELGLVPPGALLIAISAMLLFTSPHSYTLTLVWLFCLGASAGTFEIPLASYLQYRSPEETRGKVLAASNLLTNAGMLGASALFWMLRFSVPWGPEGQRVPLFSPSQIFLIAGLLTLPLAVYAARQVPHETIKFIVWFVTRFMYRIRVYGLERIPATGGGLLVSNHVSWLDGFMLLLVSPRIIRMIVYADYIRPWYINWLARLYGAIPIEPGRRSIVESLRTARDAIAAGDLVCIFPEGGLTRSNQLLAFRPGFTTVVKESHAPIIPVFLDEFWGSIFSFDRGKFFWKSPRRWPYPLSVHFGEPLYQTVDVYRVRRVVQELGTTAFERRKGRRMILPRLMLRKCRRQRFRSKVADTTGTNLTGGDVLMRTFILRRLLRRHVLAADERCVGVLLPPSAAGVLANAALTLDRRVSVNLNYTVSSDVMNQCIHQAGIRHVLTSRKVMQKLDLELDAEIVYLEDFKDQVTLPDKLAGIWLGHLVPVILLERMLGLHKVSADDLLTLIFTSGSTGEPKGVMLSHENVASNVDAMNQLVHLSPTDVLAGTLPFFHSLGYTTTLWTVLALEPKGAYHYSPLEPRQVGEMCRQHKVTILISTPTFLRSYLRRCTKEEFATMDVVVAGAEKLPVDLCDAYEEKFGLRPVEGYGTTELSPLVSVNIPANRSSHELQSLLKEGTVGRPIPGVAAKITDPDTGEELGANQPGMLWIKGPNVMLGYLNQPEKTADVLIDGWYKTGDVALVDEEGFIQITGRLSRFSKLGGEMVPHLKIEELIDKIVAADQEEMRVVVTAVPDARKGERLIVLHKPLDKTPDEICKQLAAAGLPNLWIPSPDSFCEVDEIPVLGTGKLDLRGVQNLAREKFLGQSSGSA